MSQICDKLEDVVNLNTSDTNGVTILWMINNKPGHLGGAIQRREIVPTNRLSYLIMMRLFERNQILHDELNSDPPF